MTKKPRNKPGMPTKYNDKIVAKLENILRLDVPIRVACNYVKINQDTFYNWHRDKPEFRERMDAARDYMRVAAGKVVVDKIVDDKNSQDAKWWLERKHPKEFGQQKDDGKTVNVFGDLSIENVVSLSGDERVKRIREYREKLASFGSGGGDGEGKE